MEFESRWCSRRELTQTSCRRCARFGRCRPRGLLSKKVRPRRRHSAHRGQRRWKTQASSPHAAEWKRRPRKPQAKAWRSSSHRGRVRARCWRCVFNWTTFARSSTSWRTTRNRIGRKTKTGLLLEDGGKTQGQKTSQDAKLSSQQQQLRRQQSLVKQTSPTHAFCFCCREDRSGRIAVFRRRRSDGSVPRSSRPKVILKRLRRRFLER